MTLSLSSVGIGLAFGIISVLWLGVIFNDTVIEITLTLAVSYIAYFIVGSFPSLGRPPPLLSSCIFIMFESVIDVYYGN